MVLVTIIAWMISIEKKKKDGQGHEGLHIQNNTEINKRNKGIHDLTENYKIYMDFLHHHQQ